MEEEQKANKNKKKNIIAIVIGIFVVLAIIGGIIGGTSNIDKDNQNNLNKVNYTYSDIGKQFGYDDLQITIKNFVFRDYAVQGHYYAGDNNTWILVNAEIYNPTTEYKTLNQSYALEYDDSIVFINSEGKETNYTGTFWYESEFINAHDRILPYGTITGMYAYKIPTSLIELVIPQIPLRQENTTPFNKGFYFQFSLNKRNCLNKVRVAL